MKIKEKVIPYNNGGNYKNLQKFLDSKEKSIILEYKGKHLNFDRGIKGDMITGKVPIKIIFIFKVFRIPIFKILQIMDCCEFKNQVYRFLGVKIGKEVVIAQGVWIDEMFPELITIDDGTHIGKDSTILGHEFYMRRAKFGRVYIGKQVLVGADSIIRCGVSIGKGSIVATDSFVNKDIPELTEVGGVPIREIKKLKEIV